jgi:hypothetical protein
VVAWGGLREVFSRAFRFRVSPVVILLGLESPGGCRGVGIVVSGRRQ